MVTGKLSQERRLIYEDAANLNPALFKKYKSINRKDRERFTQMPIAIGTQRANY